MMQSVNFLEIVKNRNELTLIRTPGPPLDPRMRKFPPNTLSHLHHICIEAGEGGGQMFALHSPSMHTSLGQFPYQVIVQRKSKLC